ncbi:MAG: hypothetical protein JO086_15540 [Acidimicrobiia bacterium]|nr:hypothetical protein [Acidimicrobiia bacterium]
MDDHGEELHAAAPDVGQRRLRLALLAAVAVTLVAAIPGVLLGGGDDTKSVSASQPFLRVTTSTTTQGLVAGVPMAPLPLPATTTPASVAPLQRTATTLAPKATTTTRPAPSPCRNSYDPACGPFRWDPDPGPNSPLTVTVSPQSQQGNAGQEVNFHIVAQDPDAKIDRCVVVDFGDGQTSNDCPPSPTCQAPYGPWTPPAKSSDRYELDIDHTYATAQATPYVASFQLQSHSFCSPDPYGGAAQALAQVTVS